MNTQHTQALKRLALLKELLFETTSNNAKTEILKVYRHDDLVKKLLFYMYNPYYQYFISRSNCNKNRLIASTIDAHTNGYDDIFCALDDLRNRKISGYEAIKLINQVADTPEFDNAIREVFWDIIDRDLKVRVGVSLLNKAFGKDFIPTFDVALAQPYEGGITFDKNSTWYASRKLDGVRCIAVVNENGYPTFYSRQGNVFDTLEMTPLYREILSNKAWRGKVLDGEICIMRSGVEDFQSTMKEIRRKDYTMNEAHYMVFDILTADEFASGVGTTPLKDRIKNLHQSFQTIDKPRGHMSIVAQMPITSDEAFEKLQGEVVMHGWEGLMLRDGTAVYEGKRTKKLLKVKKFHDAEYKVVDVEMGTMRTVLDGNDVEIDVLSNIVIEHKGHKVSVGSGFSREERMEYFANPKAILGKIVTVQYFEETYNQHGGVSLRFPTVKYMHGDARVA
jgi:DNA ligase-1